MRTAMVLAASVAAILLAEPTAVAADYPAKPIMSPPRPIDPAFEH